MGLPKPHIKYILHLKNKYSITGPLLTFGNQDVYATEDEIVCWMRDLNMQQSASKHTIEKSQSMAVTKINKEAKNYIHAKTLFQFMNISPNDYYDVDKFDFDNPAILWDLERPFNEKYHDFFNFIIDTGTTEHIFDIKAVMENIIQITKVGGYVLQILPAQNYLNHGFYQFSPTFFYDFYKANGFEIVESYIIEIKKQKQRFHYYDQKKDYVGLFLNPKNRLLNCFFLRKTNKVKNITSPDQYYYAQLSKNHDTVESDFNKSNLDKIVTYFRSIIPIKYHGLFFTFWQFLKRKTAKKQYFDINNA